MQSTVRTMLQLLSAIIEPAAMVKTIYKNQWHLALLCSIRDNAGTQWFREWLCVPAFRWNIRIATANAFFISFLSSRAWSVDVIPEPHEPRDSASIFSSCLHLQVSVQPGA